MTDPVRLGEHVARLRAENAELAARLRSARRNHQELREALGELSAVLEELREYIATTSVVHRVVVADHRPARLWSARRDILHVLDDADRVVATVAVEAVGAADPYRAVLEDAGWRVVEFYGGEGPGAPVALVERVVGRYSVREVPAQPVSH